jgi:hypothetical protein
MMVRHSTDLGRALVVVRPVHGGREVLVVVGQLAARQVRQLGRMLLHEHERRQLAEVLAKR